MKVHAIQCPNCKDIIFSRARHDFRTCSCGDVYIDGGFDYCRYGSIPIILAKIRHLQLTVNATKAKLYKDWNERIDKYGLIKYEEKNNN